MHLTHIKFFIKSLFFEKWLHHEEEKNPINKKNTQMSKQFMESKQKT